MKLTSCVKPHNGVPTLFVNDEPCYTPAYMTYLPENACFDSFRDAGIHLYSTCVYFGGGTINPRSNIGIPAHKGIFDDPDAPDFTIADQVISQIIETDPQAKIFPRVSISPPRWWEISHPEELCEECCNPLYPDRRVCFASEKWQEYTAQCLKIFCDHYEQNPYFQDHLVGYQLSCGTTQEWFSFDDHGGIGKPMRDAFEKQAEKDSEPGAMLRFSSNVTADVIAFTAQKVKEYTNNRVVVGAFYGYALETYVRRFAHSGFSRVLRSEYVDFLCSPMAYTDSRRCGVDHAPMLLIDSLLLHGKLYFSECDERTFLTKYPEESGVKVEPGTYREALWLGPDAQTCRNVLRNNFARCLAHGTNFWWFDMWGGWYEHPPFMEDMGAEVGIMAESATLPNRGCVAEVAVLMDETSPTYLYEITTVASNARIPLGSAGAPYHMYEMADYETIRDNYRVFVVIEPYETKRAKEVKADILARGGKLLVIDHNHPTAELLRDFYAENGVHLYNRDCKVVHVNPNYISIHNGAEAATTELLLTGVKTVTPVFEAGEAQVADKIPLSLAPFETKLFRLK